MFDNSGLTLIEVLLALFIFVTIVLVCGKCYYFINRTVIINITNKQIGFIAKNKMEELKSGYIYIDSNKYFVLDLANNIISFEEQNYNINIVIKPLGNYNNINYVNLEVSNKSGDISYNLTRYINFYGNNLSDVYEEYTYP